MIKILTAVTAAYISMYPFSSFAQEAYVTQILSQQKSAALMLENANNLLATPIKLAATQPSSTSQSAANSAHVFQIGSYNNATVAQAGLGHVATVFQQGTGNVALISQSNRNR